MGYYQQFMICYSITKSVEILVFSCYPLLGSFEGVHFKNEENIQNLDNLTEPCLLGFFVTPILASHLSNEVIISLQVWSHDRGRNHSRNQNYRDHHYFYRGKGYVTLASKTLQELTCYQLSLTLRLLDGTKGLRFKGVGKIIFVPH
ncbi:MAG: hypothetical protein ACI9O0_000155 [Paracoccaceae bacterium]|jgi:hypothetical protein